MAATSTLEVAAIEQPSTVAGARRWLRELLGQWHRAPLGDVAELVLSELVTNAVLHSPGPLRVSVSHRGGCLALEVVDANAEDLPVVSPYSVDAPTGRGMQVVEQLAAAWGVRDLAAGKGVWALLLDPSDQGAADERVARFRTETWFLDDPTTVLAASAEVAAPTRVTAVRLLDFPVRVYLAAREHHGALQRELRLIESSPGASPGARGLVGPVTAARRDLAGFERALAEQVAGAARAHGSSLALELAVTAHHEAALARLVALLDEADERCACGQLLTLASPPIVRHFRAWLLGQVRSQHDGAPATPWPELLGGDAGQETGTTEEA